MHIPDTLLSLVQQGLIDEVVRPLRSGKEAQVYLVRYQGEERVAKVYKEAHQRSFKNRSQYTEGRKVRNTRDQRAMNKQTKYGKIRDESAWRSAEADIIYRLRAADVRVPQPFSFVENVLVMELVKDSEGLPAPRLADFSPSSPEHAQEIFDSLIQNTIKMLCAGVVHGDLSEFNVLMGPDGPVIIDFPQALDPAKNRNAKRILVRDVTNLERFLARHVRKKKHTRYGSEMWALYEKQQLEPNTVLTGRAPKKVTPKAQGNSILEEMLALEKAAKERREALGLPPPKTRAPVFRNEESQTLKPRPKKDKDSKNHPTKRRRRRKRRPDSELKGKEQQKTGQQSTSQKPKPSRPVVAKSDSVSKPSDVPTKGRRRRRRRQPTQ